MHVGSVARVLPFAVIVCAGFVGFGLPGRARADRYPAPAPADPGAARTVYLRDCAVCHGADARGTSFGPSLQGVGRAALDYWLTTGRMPLVANARPAKSQHG